MCTFSVAALSGVLDARELLAGATKACRIWGTTLQEIQGKCRESNIVAARHLVWVLLVQDGCSASYVARLFGTDHKTVLSAIKKRMMA